MNYIFMPEFVSEERKKLLELYGAILHINNDEHDAFNIAIRNSQKFAKEHNIVGIISDNRPGN